MAEAQLARADHAAHILGKGQQAQAVGDGAAAFAQLFGGALLGQAVLVDELSAALGHLDGVQVFALQVFDQCQRGGLLVGHILDDDRDLVQARQPGGTPAALARNDDVPGAHLFRPHRDGLQQAVFGDAVGQLIQRILVKAFAGLFGVRLDFPQRQGRAGRLIADIGQFGKQAVQPFAKPAQLFFCHGRPSLPFVVG